MKIHAATIWKAIGATLLMAVALRSPADPAPKVPKPERNYTGIVSCVDTNDHVFRIKQRLLPAKQFAYGDNCEITFLYAILKNGMGTAGDLRAGEKVTVGFQDYHGVSIADRIEQRPMHLTGTVKRINREHRTLILHRWILEKRLRIAADCMTVLGDHQVGTLTEIHPGDQVDVVYEDPGGPPMAWQITKITAHSP